MANLSTSRTDEHKIPAGSGACKLEANVVTGMKVPFMPWVSPVAHKRLERKQRAYRTAAGKAPSPPPQCLHDDNGGRKRGYGSYW
jgi:hypothetical protein